MHCSTFEVCMSTVWTLSAELVNWFMPDCCLPRSGFDLFVLWEPQKRSMSLYKLWEKHVQSNFPMLASGHRRLLHQSPTLTSTSEVWTSCIDCTVRPFDMWFAKKALISLISHFLIYIGPSSRLRGAQTNFKTGLSPAISEWLVEGVIQY